MTISLKLKKEHYEIQLLKKNFVKRTFDESSKIKRRSWK
jgi:hypothetical protein